MMRRAAALALIGAACAGEPATPGAGTMTVDSPRIAVPVNTDSIATVQRAESLAAALDTWNSVEVISRLEDAGLVVRDLERPVDAPGYGIPGRTLSVSGGELIVFLYPTAVERLAATARLDSAIAAPPGTTASPWGASPRLITSGNLAAVLMTDREQLAERVRNVLAARHAGIHGDQ